MVKIWPKAKETHELGVRECLEREGDSGLSKLFPLLMRMLRTWVRSHPHEAKELVRTETIAFISQTF